MNRPNVTQMSDFDQYRNTQPIGRPFDGSVPRFNPSGGDAWPPADSYPYPYGRERRPVPSHVVRPLHNTPPEPVQPPEPFIANLATAKNTNKMYKEIRAIRWLLILMIFLIGVMLFCEITMAERLSSILSFNAVS